MLVFNRAIPEERHKDALHPQFRAGLGEVLQLRNPFTPSAIGWVHERISGEPPGRQRRYLNASSIGEAVHLINAVLLPQGVFAVVDTHAELNAIKPDIFRFLKRFFKGNGQHPVSNTDFHMLSPIASSLARCVHRRVLKTRSETAPTPSALHYTTNLTGLQANCRFFTLCHKQEWPRH